MTKTPYMLGKELAIRVYGLDKTAAAPGFFSRTNLIGQPGRAAAEFASGKLTQPGGLLHNFWKPQNATDFALNYGLPTYMAYKTMTSNDPHRLRTLTGLAGSTLGGLAGYKVLGLPGSLLGSGLGQTAGNLIGGLFDKAAPASHISSMPDPMMQQY